MVESMSFSGYFNFKNILFKLLHSWKLQTMLDDIAVPGDKHVVEKEKEKKR